MAVKRRYFGTDGIRGRVGASVINPEFVLKLGWAVGKVLTNGNRRKVLIGKDTRISGYFLESALEAGLSAAGVDIELLGPMPTAAVAYLTRTLRANAGIVVSASHNPFQDNGIKIFSADGRKLPDQVELAIEVEMDKPLSIVDPVHLGKASRIDDAPGRYIEFCKSTVPPMTRFAGIKIIVDCANGATYHIAPNVFRELGVHVEEIAIEPNGFNINEACGSTRPQALQKAVLQQQADLGIAFDGDGDRVIMVDHCGEILDGDELLYIIAKDRWQRKKLVGGIVGTVMSNLGLELALQALQVPFIRSQVGDRYVLEALEKQGWQLGGEGSGHIICLDKMTTGDGIITALQVLYAIHNGDCSLHDLKSDFRKLPQININVETKDPASVVVNPLVQKAVREVEVKLNSDGRVLLRPSGTEPMTRIMVQGKDQDEISQYAKQLAQVIEETVGLGTDTK
ncbi:MAG: phosphoglucosamine mutase [Gammaproteobacteria bacterium]